MHIIARGVGALLLGLSAQAVPAAEQFLMNIPGINGDVTLKNYINWISVTSFSEGLSSSQANANSGRATGRLSCQDMRVVKLLDVTSPALMGAVATGHRYPKIELVAINTGGEIQSEFLRLTLQNVAVSSVKFAGDSTTSARVETLSLIAERIEITYTPQLPDGRPDAPVSAQVECFNDRAF